jgi:hypothetical protein
MKYYLLLILLGISTFGLSQKLVKVKLTDNIKVSVPKSFTPMTDEDKAQRYESSRLPIALYTDPDRLADFGVNRAYSIWSESDLEMMQQFYEASIIELYDKVEFLSKGTRTINKKKFAYFEFESVVYPENGFQRNISKYTYLMYCISGGVTYVFNFTCEKSAKQQWQATAKAVMESIKLK